MQTLLLSQDLLVYVWMPSEGHDRLQLSKRGECPPELFLRLQEAIQLTFLRMEAETSSPSECWCVFETSTLLFKERKLQINPISWCHALENSIWNLNCFYVVRLIPVSVLASARAGFWLNALICSLIDWSHGNSMAFFTDLGGLCGEKNCVSVSPPSLQSHFHSSQSNSIW